MKTNETHKPHTAILAIEIQVHSLLKTGECSGYTVSKKILEDYGIYPEFLTTVTGVTMDDCLQKLKNKLEAFKNDNVESKQS